MNILKIEQLHIINAGFFQNENSSLNIIGGTYLGAVSGALIGSEIGFKIGRPNIIDGNNNLNGFFASLAGLFFGSISGALAGGYAAAYLSEKHN